MVGFNNKIHGYAILNQYLFTIDIPIIIIVITIIIIEITMCQ